MSVREQCWTQVGVLLRSSRGDRGGRRHPRGRTPRREEVLAANPAITALICANDVMALGSLRELRDRGLRVPDDISVTGFDDVKLAQFSDPPLTSVHISREEIGRIVCDCLFGPANLAPREFVIIPSWS